MSRRALLPLVCVAVADALVVQPNGYAQSSFFALTRALAHGTPRIDAYHWWSLDVSWWHGHYFSNKAPGLGFLVTPLSALLHALGAQPIAPKAHLHSLGANGGVGAYAIWPLTLLGATAAALALMIVVRNRVEKVEPGYGTAAALALGACTLVLPFSTLLFDHVLSALLAFGAFAVLWHERHGPQRRWLVAAGGLVAGLAVVAEYPSGLMVAVLAVYAICRERPIPRAAVYGAGVLVGVLPLLVYDMWAFGSPFHLSYVGAVSNPGNSGHDHLDANSTGFFGIGVPSARVALELLFQHRGLLSVSPVLALAAVGAVTLARRGWRAEALVIAAVFAAYLVYNAGYYIPYGGGTPGPRFLITALPFLAVAVAPAFREHRVTTSVLALLSCLMLLAATATQPLLGDDQTRFWAETLRRNELHDTVFAALFGWHGIVGFAPVLLLLAAAFALGYRSLPAVRLTRRDFELAAYAALAWVLVMVYLAPLLRSGVGTIAAVALLLALIVNAVALVRYSPLAALPALLFVLVPAGLYLYPGWTLGVALVAGLVPALALARRRPSLQARPYGR